MNPNASKRLSNFQIGLIAVVITFFGFYLAFTKSIPFVSGGGYELKAVFQDAQNLRVKSPVRVSGVDVGKVTQVQHLSDANGQGEDAALVTMRLQDKALPIHEDARLAIRPRLFLEGNLFVEVNPGSPSAPELHSGSTVPEDQTQISVQLDEVLTSLQAPVRTDLQIFLKEFGDALDKYGGAEGFRESFRTSPAAYRYTSEVNEALLGRQPGDLAGFIHNFDTVISELDQNRTDLQGLITNFEAVSGSFAANQSSLRQAIIELPQALAIGRPTLAKLNSDFPALRAFAREALPGTKAANKALDYANPWIGQMRQLVSKGELRGLIKDLRPTIPDLANLTNASLPFLEQTRLFASCFNNVVIPWSNTPIPNNDSDPPAAKVYQETAYGLTGVAGESRTGDANGQMFRVLAGGGPNTIGPITTQDPVSETVFGVAPFNIIGAEPAKQSSRKTPYHPEVPCETQEAPNLNTFIQTGIPQTKASARSDPSFPADLQALTDEYKHANQLIAQATTLSRQGNAAEAKSTEQQGQDLLDKLWNQDWPAYQKAHGLKQGGAG